MISPTRQIVYRQSGLPLLQNRVYSTRIEAISCATGDIELTECVDTGLVYNVAFESSRVVYDKSYDNEQAHSPAFRMHLAQVAEIIDRGMGRAGLVEVGCGKGVFLEILTKKGFDISGFDPAYTGDNPRIRPVPFSPKESMEAKGLIIRHVLEHIASPYKFIEEVAQANGFRGLVYIEVPCLEWILAHNAWWDMFYEHVNYFRLAQLEGMFGRVVESGRLFGGQYIYIVGDLTTLRKPIRNEAIGLAFSEKMIPNCERFRGSKSVAIWGCASKGVIFAIHANRSGLNINYGIDINPAKQNKYLPITGIPVISPSEALRSLPADSRIVVMNPNYLGEVRASVGNTFSIEGLE